MCKTCTKLWLWVWAQESNVVHVCRLSVCLATAELPAYSVTSVGGVLWVMAAMKIVTKLLQCVHDLLINVFCISSFYSSVLVYYIWRTDRLKGMATLWIMPLWPQFLPQYGALSSKACIVSVFFTVSVSVCPSVTRSYRVNTNDRRIVHFHHRVLVVVAHRLVFRSTSKSSKST